MLPEIIIKQPKNKTPADTATKEVVRAVRQFKNKTAHTPDRKTKPGVKLTAMLTKLKDDE